AVRIIEGIAGEDDPSRRHRESAAGADAVEFRSITGISCAHLLVEDGRCGPGLAAVCGSNEPQVGGCRYMQVCVVVKYILLYIFAAAQLRAVNLFFVGIVEVIPLVYIV